MVRRGRRPQLILNIFLLVALQHAMSLCCRSQASRAWRGGLTGATTTCTASAHVTSDVSSQAGGDMLRMPSQMQPTGKRDTNGARNNSASLNPDGVFSGANTGGERGLAASGRPTMDKIPSLEMLNEDEFTPNSGEILRSWPCSMSAANELSSLENVRNLLIRLEETIIFTLIEREQFRQNSLIYTRRNFRLNKDGVIAIYGRDASFLEYMLCETEKLHARGESKSSVMLYIH